MTKSIKIQFEEDLTAVIDEYRGNVLTFADMIGALELVKLSLFSEMNEGE